MIIAMSAVAPIAWAAPGPRSRPAVTIKTASDASPGVLEAHVRERHAEILRQALLDALHRTGADVRHAGMPPRQIDVSITAWHIAAAANRVDVSTELRVVICDEHGKMLSIVTGRAKVSARVRTARLGELREQALAEAVGGMTRSLASQFDRAAS